MASAEHEPIAGIWGQSPQRQGSRGRSPPEAESILVIGCPTEPANLALHGMNGLTVNLSALRKTSANN